jgi:hypothetical protein
LEDSNFWLICPTLKTIFFLKFPHTTYASWNCTSFSNMITAPPSSMHCSLLIDNKGKCTLDYSILPLEGNPLNLVKLIFHYWRTTVYIFELLDSISYVLLFDASCSRICLSIHASSLNAYWIPLKLSMIFEHPISFIVSTKLIKIEPSKDLPNHSIYILKLHNVH